MAKGSGFMVLAAEARRQLGGTRGLRLLMLAGIGHVVLAAFHGYGASLQGYYATAHVLVPVLVMAPVAALVAADRESGFRTLLFLSPRTALPLHAAYAFAGLLMALLWGLAGAPVGAYLAWAGGASAMAAWARGWLLLPLLGIFAGLLGLLLGMLMMPKPGRSVALTAFGVAAGLGLAFGFALPMYVAASGFFDAGWGRLFSANPVYALLAGPDLPRLGPVAGLEPGPFLLLAQVGMLAGLLALLWRRAFQPLGWREGGRPAAWALLSVALVALPTAAFALEPAAPTRHSISPGQVLDPDGLPEGMATLEALEGDLPARVGESLPARMVVRLPGAEGLRLLDVRPASAAGATAVEFRPTDLPVSFRDGAAAVEGVYAVVSATGLAGKREHLPLVLVLEGGERRAAFLILVEPRTDPVLMGASFSSVPLGSAIAGAASERRRGK